MKKKNYLQNKYNILFSTNLPIIRLFIGTCSSYRCTKATIKQLSQNVFHITIPYAFCSRVSSRSSPARSFPTYPEIVPTFRSSKRSLLLTLRAFSFVMRHDWIYRPDRPYFSSVCFPRHSVSWRKWVLAPCKYGYWRTYAFLEKLFWIFLPEMI